MSDSDQPATKQDLKDLERDLKQFIVEREVISLRWFMALQVTYFFGTLAAVWFMISHLPR